MAGAAIGQPTHVEQLQDLGIRCLGSVPSDLSAFRLDSDERAPYVRSGLFSFWNEGGKQVFSNDSTRTEKSLPLLAYRIDQVRIELNRLNSDRVERLAVLDIRYTLSGPGGQLLADNLCSESATDTLSTELADAFKDSRYPETSVQLQSTGWFHRIIQPAVVAGAAAIGAYLFFNLRSRRSDDG